MTPDSTQLQNEKTGFVVGLRRELQRVLPYARKAVRRPLVGLYALATAFRAQITAAVLLVTLIFVLPPVLNFGVNSIIPPQKDSKLLGLVKTKKTRPIAKASYGFFMFAAWVSVSGIIVLRFWRQIPDGVERAQTLAGRWAGEAETKAASNPTESRRLYRAALMLTADDHRRDLIRSQMQSLPDQPDMTQVQTGQGSPSETIVSNPAQSGQPATPSGRYRIDGELGRGAMGVVYRATDTVLERTVALKELPARLTADTEYVERFKQEAKALAQLSHPNIMQVYDLVENDGRIWMALEFVDGGTLADRLKDNGPIDYREAATLISQVAAGLTLAHSRGIIHRDIKPSNVLLSTDGTAKISDFGIAKLARATALTQEGATLGSPAYMSPEQCFGGEIDHRTDIYALGITLYELLAGRTPFTGDTATILAQHVVNQPPSLADSVAGIPETFERVVMQMLAKKPEDRFQSMSELVESLADYNSAPSPSAQNADHL